MAAPKLFNLAQMTTYTTGTGPITLIAATPGYRTFTAAGVVNGDLVRYFIYEANLREYGYGTVTIAGSTVTLSRTFQGSTTGALLNLQGSAVVTLSPTAEDFVKPVDIAYRSDIATISTNQLYLRTLDGATWVHGTSTGPMAIQDAAGQWWQLDLSNGCSVKWFGAVGDGTTDDTATIQAAINAVQSSTLVYILHMPTGMYRCTAPLTITGRMSIAGEGASSWSTRSTPGTLAELHGTWFYFNHTGRGIYVYGTPEQTVHVELSEFGTFRDQPVPAPGWAPNANDYDIYKNNADLIINDLMLLNPTLGLASVNGRLEIDLLRGQALNNLIYVDRAYDVCRFSNIHQWPFWLDDLTYVHPYTLANLDAINSLRNDNPHFSSIFSIWARSGIRFSQSASGRTAKVHLVNADFDNGTYGIWVDNTVTNGVTGQFANVTYQSYPGVTGSVALQVDGNSSSLAFSNFDSQRSDNEGVVIGGTSNNVYFVGQTNILSYNQSAGGYSAFNVANGNQCHIANVPVIGGGGAGAAFSTTGDIRADVWRVFTTTVTSVTGSIATLGTVSAVYKKINFTVYFELNITITTNGTGAGAVRATLPVAVTGNFTAVGRDGSARALTGNLAGGGSNCDINLYTNAYPGADGAHLIVNGYYQVS